MQTNVRERAAAAVFSKLGAALAEIARALADDGPILFDLGRVEESCQQFLEDYYAQSALTPGEGEDGPLDLLFEFGENGASPNSLAVSVAAFAMISVVEQSLATIKALERHADELLKAWADRKAGQSVEVDFRRLVAVKKGPCPLSTGHSSDSRTSC